MWSVDTGAMRVLVVEDDPHMAALLQRGLSEEGALVAVAPTARDGVCRAEDAHYDVIVLDLMLPDASGVQVCRRLRADRIWTPVLMLTARDAITDRVAGLDAGADDYLEGHAELIARAVRNMLDNALKHGAGEITVAVHSAGDAVGVHVTDDGPGFSAQFLPHAFDKFSRADPARAAGGSGLGLAVVQAAAGAHDGAAVAENRPGGGPRVSLTLPVAPRSHADVCADTPGYPGVSAHDRLGSF
jgi:signal transduction histidine kinase